MKNIMFNLPKFIPQDKRPFIVMLCIFAVMANPLIASAETNTISAVNYSTLPGDQVEVRISMDNPASIPGSFTIDYPARIAFDFPDTKINLSTRSQSIGVGVVRSLNVVEAGGRSRVVLNLSKLVAYQTYIDGNDVVVKLGTNTANKNILNDANSTNSLITLSQKSVENIDFRRGEKGEGRIIIDLSDPNTSIDLKTRGDKVILLIKNSSISNELERRLDVIDFGTPVSTIDAFNHRGDVKIIIRTIKDFEQIAYQADNSFTIDIKPIAELTAAEKQKNEFTFKGERLSLNFQNIEVRAVLQLIADFTDLNLITSDTVQGNVTLRLKNVPWDQALDIILRSKGLAMIKEGNVISIAPATEVAARAKLDESIDAQAPLISESIQINYAKASDLTALLKTKDNSLLSERGSVSVDVRTNKLLIRDTVKNIDAITILIQELDIPVKQVLIEARIVLATNDFSRELGVRFGVSNIADKRNAAGSGRVEVIGGGHTEVRALTTNVIRNETLDYSYPGLYNVNLPATNLAATAGKIGLAFANLPLGTLLDLELSAAQAEGKSETISSPRIITSDQEKAIIETGTEIPYQEASSSGATSVTFKKAVLKLEVTPQITPDDRIIMDLKVNKDTPDFANVVLGVPPINTQSIQTKVLVDNGETIVLGGVYEQTKSQQVNRIPFFADLPIVGFLFRNEFEQNDKSELLIFITPKILKENLKL